MQKSGLNFKLLIEQTAVYLKLMRYPATVHFF